jgi:hypothetical protein
MPKQRRRKGSDETALQESSDAAAVMQANNTKDESVRTAATAGVTDNEIAPLAYRLWLDDGCPVGLDREYWFRAEAMLNKVLAARREDLPGHPSPYRTESETLAGLPWEGHWEAWEMEWGGARWIWDEPAPGAVANRQPACSETGATARRLRAV